MLVLTRNRDQEIRIGDDIVVRILDVRGDRVRIGIDAPSEVSVHRQEVYIEIEKANRESMTVAGAGLSGARALVERHKAAGTNNGKRRSARSTATVSTEVNHGT